jgi:hypothetical protein
MLFVMGDRQRDVLLHNVFRTLSQSSQQRVDGASRKFRRNLKQSGNGNRGVRFDVLGMSQTYPGGEHRELVLYTRPEIRVKKFFGGQIPRRFLVAAPGTPVGDEQLRGVSRAFARSPPESPRCDQKANGANGIFLGVICFFSGRLLNVLIPCTAAENSHMNSHASAARQWSIREAPAWRFRIFSECEMTISLVYN